MSIEADSKHYEPYYKQVLNGIRSDGILGKIYDIITDLTNRRGLRQEWEQLYGKIQDKIISDWIVILSQKKPIYDLVDELASDISERGGIGNQWNMIDDDIQEEIKDIWKEILTEN
jgi:hypothetical protein